MAEPRNRTNGRRRVRPKVQLKGRRRLRGKDGEELGDRRGNCGKAGKNQGNERAKECTALTGRGNPDRPEFVRPGGSTTHTEHREALNRPSRWPIWPQVITNGKGEGGEQAGTVSL